MDRHAMLLGLIMASGGPTPSSVVKGDIISFDAFGDGTQQRFRVLSVNGTVAKIISFAYAYTGRYNGNMGDVFPNGNGYAKYKSSYVDDYLNYNFYISLSSTVQNAIISETYVQTVYDSPVAGQDTLQYDLNIKTASGYTYSMNKLTEKEVGSRYVRALDVDDILEYFGVTPTNNIIQAVDMLELLTESTTPPANYYSFGSAMPKQGSTHRSAVINSSRGHISANSIESSSMKFAAVFSIDLSQIQYTKE